MIEIGFGFGVRVGFGSFGVTYLVNQMTCKNIDTYLVGDFCGAVEGKWMFVDEKIG